MEYLQTLYNKVDTPLFNKVINNLYNYHSYSEVYNLNQEDMNKLKELDLLFDLSGLEYRINTITSTDLMIEGRGDAEVLRIVKSLIKSKGIEHIIETLLKNKKDRIVPHLFKK